MFVLTVFVLGRPGPLTNRIEPSEHSDREMLRIGGFPVMTESIQLHKPAAAIGLSMVENAYNADL